jgi:Glycosyl-hydrolase 97 C-terminal, oligomerisation
MDLGAGTSVKLDFLKEGTWKGVLIRDGADDRTFESLTSNDLKPGEGAVVGVPMRPRGGFVMRLERTDQKGYR